jgi:hypothetical protein
MFENDFTSASREGKNVNGIMIGMISCSIYLIVMMRMF